MAVHRMQGRCVAPRLSLRLLFGARALHSKLQTWGYCNLRWRGRVELGVGLQSQLNRDTLKALKGSDCNRVSVNRALFAHNLILEPLLNSGLEREALPSPAPIFCGSRFKVFK